MKAQKTKYLFAVAILMFISCTLYAQRMQHGNRAGGASRPAANRGSINGGAQHSKARPATTKRPTTAARPKTQNRDISKVKPANRNQSTKNLGTRDNNKKVGSGDRTTHIDKKNIGSGNTKNTNISGNRVNIDNSKNVNINVNRNVRVNNNSRNRYYNGYRGYHPYHYHPYRPHYYGPRWHPFGFFLATMYTTAVIVSLNNQPYYYDQGVYYIEKSGGYESVPPPVNITITSLPDGVEKIEYDKITYYYFGGTFYEKVSDGFKVIEAPDGAIVSTIPEGGTEIEIEGIKYVVYNDTYFQPLAQDGVDLYQVVLMEPV